MSDYIRNYQNANASATFNAEQFLERLNQHEPLQTGDQVLYAKTANRVEAKRKFKVSWSTTGQMSDAQRTYLKSMSQSAWSVTAQKDPNKRKQQAEKAVNLVLDHVRAIRDEFSIADRDKNDPTAKVAWEKDNPQAAKNYDTERELNELLKEHSNAQSMTLEQAKTILQQALAISEGQHLLTPVREQSPPATLQSSHQEQQNSEPNSQNSSSQVQTGKVLYISKGFNKKIEVFQNIMEEDQDDLDADITTNVPHDNNAKSQKDDGIEQNDVRKTSSSVLKSASLLPDNTTQETDVLDSKANLNDVNVPQTLEQANNIEQNGDKVALAQGMRAQPLFEKEQLEKLAAEKNMEIHERMLDSMRSEFANTIKNMAIDEKTKQKIASAKTSDEVHRLTEGVVNGVLKQPQQNSAAYRYFRLKHEFEAQGKSMDKPVQLKDMQNILLRATISDAFSAELKGQDEIKNKALKWLNDVDNPALDEDFDNLVDKVQENYKAIYGEELSKDDIESEVNRFLEAVCEGEYKSWDDAQWQPSKEPLARQLTEQETLKTLGKNRLVEMHEHFRQQAVATQSDEDNKPDKGNKPDENATSMLSSIRAAISDSRKGFIVADNPVQALKLANQPGQPNQVIVPKGQLQTWLKKIDRGEMTTIEQNDVGVVITLESKESKMQLKLSADEKNNELVINAENCNRADILAAKAALQAAKLAGKKIPELTVDTNVLKGTAKVSVGLNKSNRFNGLQIKNLAVEQGNLEITTANVQPALNN